MLQKQHFLSALRIEPEHREAREGLLHAFRARSPLYRAYLKYSFMMEKLGRAGRGMVVIGLLVLMQLANMAFVGTVGADRNGSRCFLLPVRFVDLGGERCGKSVSVV